MQGDNLRSNNKSSLDESVLMEAYNYGYAMVLESYKTNPLWPPVSELVPSQLVYDFISDFFDRLRNPGLEYLEVAVDKPEPYILEFNRRIDSQIKNVKKEWDNYIDKYYESRKN